MHTNRIKLELGKRRTLLIQLSFFFLTLSSAIIIENVKEKSSINLEHFNLCTENIDA